MSVCSITCPFPVFGHYQWTLGHGLDKPTIKSTLVLLLNVLSSTCSSWTSCVLITVSTSSAVLNSWNHDNKYQTAIKLKLLWIIHANISIRKKNKREENLMFLFLLQVYEIFWFFFKLLFNIILILF